MSIQSELRRVTDLAPHPLNYNTHPEPQVNELQASLEQFDQFKNIVIWSPPEVIDLGNGQSLRPDMSYILAGHGLWLAATRAGREHIEVKDYSGIPYEEALLLIEVDNAAPAGAIVDTAKLAALAERTRGLVVDKPRLEAMLERAREAAGVVNGSGDEGKDTEAQISRADELQEVWQVKSGDLWSLGEHYLLCADCTDPEAAQAVAFGEPFGFVFTDPPYSVGYADKNKSLNAVAKGNRIQTPIENDHLSTEETAAKVWLPAFGNLFKLAKPGAVYYITAPQGGDQMMMMMMMIKEAGWLVKHELIWVKNNHVLGRADYHYKHEPLVYGWKPGAAHYFIDSRSEVSTWFIDKPHNSDLHPTEKPLELVERAIRNSSRPGEIVADFFAGSGTTIISAHNLGRKCRAIEISEAYCSVILERYKQHTDHQPQLLGNGG